MPVFVIRVIAGKGSGDDYVDVGRRVGPVRHGGECVSHRRAYVARGFERDGGLDGGDAAHHARRSVAGQAASRLEGGVFVEARQVSEVCPGAVGVGLGLASDSRQEERRGLDAGRAVSEEPGDASLYLALGRARDLVSLGVGSGAAVGLDQDVGLVDGQIVENVAEREFSERVEVYDGAGHDRGCEQHANDNGGHKPPVGERAARHLGPCGDQSGKLAHHSPSSRDSSWMLTRVTERDSQASAATNVATSAA